jgi:hypothetical protein
MNQTPLRIQPTDEARPAGLNRVAFCDHVLRSRCREVWIEYWRCSDAWARNLPPGSDLIRRIRFGSESEDLLVSLSGVLARLVVEEQQVRAWVAASTEDSASDALDRLRAAFGGVPVRLEDLD